MTQEIKPTYLYVKTHNVTGLKYFGKTISNDPHKYKGSGIRWLNHIRKHGYDVSTEIVGLFTDFHWCLLYALEFSELHNIVASNDWANLKTESVDGGLDHITRENVIKAQSSLKANRLVPGYNEKTTRNTVKYNRENKKLYFDPEFRAKGVEAARTLESIQIRKDTFKEIKHQVGSTNSQFGSMWITNGTLNKKIKKDDNLPEGWYKGRITSFGAS